MTLEMLEESDGAERTAIEHGLPKAEDREASTRT